MGKLQLCPHNVFGKEKCAECRRIRNRKAMKKYWRSKKGQAYRIAYETLPHVRKIHANYRTEVVKKLFAAYGNCSGCGCSILKRLTLHHPNHDGGAHRKALGIDGGWNLYAALKKRGYPNPDLVNGVPYYLEILCNSCHGNFHSRKSIPSR